MLNLGRVVGIRSFPFGARLIFRGEMLNFQGVYQSRKSWRKNPKVTPSKVPTAANLMGFDWDALDARRKEREGGWEVCGEDEVG